MSVDVSELVTETGTDLKAARARAAEQAALAAEAKAQAEAAIAEAEQAEREGRRDASNRYTSAVRALTSEVDEHRKAAEAAVLTADGPTVLSAWLKWRLTRAANMGRWDQLRGQYRGLTGQNAPPGAWGPPTSKPGSPGGELPFHKWLQQATVRAEQEAAGQARRATSDELKARREAARTEAED